jgi:Ca-activated chloride channel family protein
MNKSYPKDFLQHRMAKVDVQIVGQVAMTTVYEEFVNEWYLSTDAVYSFPLPPDARATNFYYWYGDTMYRATLKVQEQAPNPGPGEGGVDAEVTKYLGRNGIRVLLNGIPPGKIQRVRLEYIQQCQYYNAGIEYYYPLNTDKFTMYPLESFSFNINVQATDDILTSTVQNFPEANFQQAGARSLRVAIDVPKMYINKDLIFTYTTRTDSLDFDFFAVDNDTSDGHFALFLKPSVKIDSSKIFPKTVVFVLDCSSTMYGINFDQSKLAIKDCLENLNQGDKFNIVTFASTATAWQASSVSATPQNIASASMYINSLSTSSGSSLSAAFGKAFQSITLDTVVNAILLFSDGKAAMDPKLVQSSNIHKAGIFSIGIGPEINRSRLEMISYLNYGFPTFPIDANSIYTETRRVMSQIDYPVMRDAKMELGSNVIDLLPRTLNSVYYGSRFFLTGRYKNPQISSMSIAGYSVGGPVFYDFRLSFPAEKVTNKFVQSLWAKEKIDYLERLVDVYGPADSLKRQLIALSLGYNIRCRYTAYVADKVPSDVEEAAFTGTSTTKLADGILIEWNFRTKENIRGFNVYVSTRRDGNFTKLTDSLIHESRYIIKNLSAASRYVMIEAITSLGKRVYSTTLSLGGDDVPANFELSQNYPNPFNPSTTIKFGVPVRSHVRVTILNILGQQVTELVNEERESGYHTVSWNANVPSGIYLYRLEVLSIDNQSKRFIETKKMLLVR